MAVTYAVNGPAIAYWYPSGTDVLLGVTEDGVEWIKTPHIGKIHTDVSGPMVPQELQYLGEEHRLRFKFSVIDYAQWALVAQVNDQTTYGKTGTPGLLLFTGGYVIPRIGITGALGLVFNLYNCVLDPRMSHQLSVVAKSPVLEFVSYPLQLATAVTGLGVKQFDRTVVVP